jgi:AcrR family transcriptional regulator
LTREDILEASALIFSKKGYHAASMQDIARAVNLQKASLYHYFSGKQEILLALLERGLDLLFFRLEEIISKPLSPDEKLRLAMISYLETLAEYQNLAAVLILEHRSLDEEKRVPHIERRDQFERLWRDLIQEGIDKGIFYCTSPSLTGRGILGVLNWTVTWYQADGPSSANEIAVQYADLFINGLISKDGQFDK